MKDDYSDVIFSTGLVCFNSNNNAYCIVINGNKGDERDRCALVLEFHGKGEFILHTPPNRALRPTGGIANLGKLKQILNSEVL